MMIDLKKNLKKIDIEELIFLKQDMSQIIEKKLLNSEFSTTPASSYSFCSCYATICSCGGIPCISEDCIYYYKRKYYGHILNQCREVYKYGLFNN
jgi:hypothetical protein